MKFIAKTFKGLESVLAEELRALGAKRIAIERRAVTFEGDKALLYRANFALRTASRGLYPILTFKAQNTDQLYEQVKAFDWSSIMDARTSFAIASTVYSPLFRHSQFVTYRVKDAIADYWLEHTSIRPSVCLDNPDLSVNVHIADNQVTISLDSSGISLHKRGYRVANTQAPLNEALAAGMLLIAGWNGQCDFYDPMCGSGTLLIEAALIAKNIAPGVFREAFAFEKWKDFDAALWNEIYNDDSAERPFNHHIYGSDASFYAIETARKNIARAGQNKTISLKQIRLQEIHSPWGANTATDNLVMMNPPYGERLAQDKDIRLLYADIGTALKHHFAPATAWIISSNEEALKNIGLKPEKKMHLLNGELDCSFRCFRLY